MKQTGQAPLRSISSVAEEVSWRTIAGTDAEVESIHALRDSSAACLPCKRLECAFLRGSGTGALFEVIHDGRRQ